MVAVLVGVIVVAGIGVAVSIVSHVQRAERERSAALREAAARAGWGYRPEVKFDDVPKLDRFELFRQGRNRKLRHLLTSPAGEVRAVLFDYAYTTGGGNSQATHRQTVFYAVADGLRLPSFSLRPEHFFHKIGAKLGMQDIDLERRPEFSRMFLLRGEDESAVRDAFTETVAEFFERRPHTCAAGLGRELLFWKPSRLVKPEELEAFIEEGMALAGRFSGSARQP